MTNGDEFRTYLAGLEGRGQEGLRRGPAAQIARRFTSHETRERAKVALTDLSRPVQRRKLMRLAEHHTPLLLNLGSGRRRIPGWINVDLFGMNPHVAWNLNTTLPLRKKSVDGVFLEHTLEHFSPREALGILEDCRDLLRPGGIVRVGVPDFSKYMRAYVLDPGTLDVLRPGRPLPILAVQEVVICHGHRSAWDGELLTTLLDQAGYVGGHVTPFGDSALPAIPDTPDREAESVYAEAVAP